MNAVQRLLRASIVLVVAVVAVLAGWFLFLEYPQSPTELVGVVLLIVVGLLGVRFASNVAAGLVPGYNVAEVSVEGPISRNRGGGPLPSGPVGADADDVVEQIERADEDGNVDALLVKLNTPGGEIVPSEDVRLAAERFDGPTVAYATDVCASGGYDIASGCDELWAREGSIVGSIGVIGSRVTAADLADRLGLEYQQFTAGEYKDAGMPLKDMSDDERAYLQGIVDDYYDHFVETVVEGRGLDADTVRDTEARIYLGGQAADLGLVDEIGTRKAVEERVSELIDEDAEIESFEPAHGLSERLRGGASEVAFAAGAGIASTLDEGDLPLKLR